MLFWITPSNKKVAKLGEKPYVTKVLSSQRAARSYDMASTGTMKKPVASQRLELLRSAPLNAWIALSADESHIVATGNTFLEADEAAKKTGEEGYFLTKTPQSWLPRAMRTIEI